MSHTTRARRGRARQGAAAVELAVLLPFLSFLFVIAIDWSRLFYHSVIVTNCARNGALFLSDPHSQNESPYANVTEAALADAPNLEVPPTVISSSGSDANGPYAEVTVSTSFQTITNFPGVPKTTQLTRKVRVGVAQKLPN